MPVLFLFWFCILYTMAFYLAYMALLAARYIIPMVYYTNVTAAIQQRHKRILYAINVY